MVEKKTSPCSSCSVTSSDNKPVSRSCLPSTHRFATTILTLPLTATVWNQRSSLFFSAKLSPAFVPFGLALIGARMISICDKFFSAFKDRCGAIVLHHGGIF